MLSGNRFLGSSSDKESLARAADRNLFAFDIIPVEPHFSPLGRTKYKAPVNHKKRNMKKQAIYALRTFRASALVLTFVLMPISIDTAQAQ